MALIGNYTVLNKTAGTFRSGGATGLGLVKANFNQAGKKRNFFAGWAGVDPKNSFPSGYTPSVGAYVIAQKSGGLAASTTIYSVGDIDFSNLAGGLNAVSDLTGTGEITNAALALVLSAVASLTGTSTFTASVFAELNAVADLTGSGDLDGAINALAHVLASLTGDGEVSSTSVATAKATISSNIVVTGELLNTLNIAAALLDAQNGIETGLTLRQALRLIAAASAGKVSGAETTTVTIRNAVADSKDRIVASVDENGNRTAITTDVD